MHGQQNIKLILVFKCYT